MRITWSGAMWVMLAVAVTLRLWGASVNRQANDDHIEVVNLIVDEGRWPKHGECWECLQPKLYHGAVAMVVQTGNLTGEARIVAGQMVSALAGGLTLLALMFFLRQLPVPAAVQATTFGVVGLNSRLFAINIQATNDSLVILWGTLALWALWHFLRRPAWRWGVALGAATVLAALTKGNGVVVFLAVAVTLGITAAVHPEHRRRAAGALLAVGLAVAVAGSAAGPYLDNWRGHGSPFAGNSAKSPAPDFWAHSVERRPGITSIASGFFTFRLVDAVAIPLTPVAPKQRFPQHRTSLWTHVYGRASAIRFIQWPLSWIRYDGAIVWFNRIALLLGLAPAALWLGELGARSRGLLMGVVWLPESRQKLREALRRSELLWLVAVWGFVAFLMKYAYDYRDFAYMKLIYLLPALPAFAWLLAHGIARARNWGKWPRRALGVLLPALMIWHTVDAAWLCHDLGEPPASHAPTAAPADLPDPDPGINP